MKKSKTKFFIIVVLFFLVYLSGVRAIVGERFPNVKVSLLNQDPYPAQQDDYVEIVFKIENVGRVEVKDFLIHLLPEYPFSLDPGDSGLRDIGNLGVVQHGDKAVFVKYKLRVDKDAIDGEHKIKVRYTYDSNKKWENYIIEEFNITVEDSRTDFDVAIQDYSPKTNTLSLAISNIGKKNASSVTVILPEQEEIELVGSNKNIIGGIETNDYTIASFKIIPKKDGPIKVVIAYTDERGIRREIEKTVNFKATSYYNTQNIKQRQDYRSLSYIIIGILGIIAVLVIIYILRKKRKKGQEKNR